MRKMEEDAPHVVPHLRFKMPKEEKHLYKEKNWEKIREDSVVVMIMPAEKEGQVNEIKNVCFGKFMK